MSSQVLHRIFGALQTLEQSLTVCQSTVGKNKHAPKRIVDALGEQERLVRQMRRVANKLQVETAQKDWDAAYRSLNIFYALNQMVRPEVISTFRELSGLPPIGMQKNVSNNETQSAMYH